MPELLEKQDVLTRLQEDIRRALEKPAAERHWVMVIDLGKCIGCHACTVACVAENKLPPGVVYRPVLDEEVGEYPIPSPFSPRPASVREPPLCAVCRSTPPIPTRTGS
jgi:molybdopterin-containing oxidoreductase family iron-sulfur binding subunit